MKVFINTDGMYYKAEEAVNPSCACLPLAQQDMLDVLTEEPITQQELYTKLSLQNIQRSPS